MRLPRRPTCVLGTMSLGLLAALPPGCSAGGDIQVRGAYAPGMALTKVGKSFEWAALTQEQTQRWAQVEDLKDLVYAEVEQQFAAKGYTRRSSPPPDFLVRPHVAKDSYTDSAVNPHGETLERGALILDIIQQSSGKTIWRGAATARLEPNLNIDQRRERVRRGAELLVDRFIASNK